MFLSLLAAQVLVAAPLSPPPVVTSSRIAGNDQAVARRIRFDVTLRSAEGVLWSGPLWVGSRGQSSWRQTLSQPSDDVCPERGYSYETDQSELFVNLSLASGNNEIGPQITINARWTRPLEGKCSGTRPVELRQIEMVTENGMISVKGDGGLIVELRRR